jgi:hypothetical protein
MEDDRLLWVHDTKRMTTSFDSNNDLTKEVVWFIPSCHTLRPFSSVERTFAPWWRILLFQTSDAGSDGIFYTASVEYILRKKKILYTMFYDA